MSVVLHPPEAVTVEGDLADDARREIERALLAAVGRALAAVEPGADAAEAEDTIRVPAAPGEVGEPLDPSRLAPAGGSYRLPSYSDEGRLTGVQLLEKLPKAKPGFMVLDRPSPVDGALIIRLHGNLYKYLRSPRYAAAGTLTEAGRLGLAIYGTTSFAILQGPMGSPDMRYLAVSTEEPLSDEDLGAPSETLLPEELTRRRIQAVDEEMQQVLHGSNGRYLTRGLVTRDRIFHWPSVDMAALWYAQLDAERAAGVQLEPEAFRIAVFDEIDALVDQIEAGDDSGLQKAAEMLNKLDEFAFSLVTWEVKVRYLKVLLAAWTWEEEEKAVVAIFKSLDNDTQVDAVVAMLKKADRYNQLVDDLNSQLYDLLTVVGRKFPRDHSPLTFEGLIALFESMGVLPKTALEALTGLEQGPDGTIVPPDLLDEARQAALGLLNMAVDLGESIVTIFKEPGKLVQGIAALTQLIVKVELARMGDIGSAIEVAELLARVGDQVLAGMRGADRLGVGPKVLRRLKWRLIWEIASLFIGLGELKAAVQATGIGEKLAGVLRFLGILARLGEAVDAELEGARLARLAALLKAERTAFASVDEVAELLSHLPEDDVRKLGRLLSTYEIREGEKLADLAARSSELHAAAGDALAKAELLKTLAGKAGGLSDEIGEAFRTLIRSDGLELGQAQKVVQAIPEGEGVRFAATLRRFPLGRLNAETRLGVLEMLAASPRRMDAFAKVGFETFGALWRRAAGKEEAIDRYIGALDRLEARFAEEGKQAEYRRFLDRLERDEPDVWLQVENERRVQAGQPAISEWLRVTEGSPRAQAGLDKLIRRGHDDVVANMLERESEHVVRDQLRQIGELSDRQVDGVAAIKRVEKDLNGDIGGQWFEVLDLPANFRDPMLDLVADIERSVDGGLDLAIKRGLTGSHNDIQGTLGHLFAARTLRDRFPGARFRFELPAARREIDIQMNVMGRQVDVEVKTNLGLEPTVNNAQIYKDLERHIGDQWADMLYRYAPQQAANTGRVERGMLRQLARLHAEGKLPAGMTLPQAEAILRSRMNAAAPWRLVDVFAY